MKYLTFILILGLFSFSDLCGQGRLPAAQTTDVVQTRPHVLDVTHLRLQVSFEPEEGKVTGKVVHTFKPLRPEVDSIFFDGPGIAVKNVWLDKDPVKFKTGAKGISVFPSYPLTWEEEHTITISYEATPGKGLYFTGWNDTAGISKKQIWTQGQGIDNRHWIPVYDERNDKTVTEVIVKFDKDFEVISNGRKISEKDNGDHTKTWRYKTSYPHSTYLIMLGIGEYKTDTQYSESGVPLHLYYYPDYPDLLEPTYKYSSDMITFMENYTSFPYPWSIYRQVPVQDYMYGAMENTTATVFSDLFLNDEHHALSRGYVGINMHELSHQWFGDCITSLNPKSAWLQEGFATFFSKIYRKEIFGEETYQWIKHKEIDASLYASGFNKRSVTHYKAGRRIYYKGSMVLDMLRQKIGDAAFRKVLKHFMEEHAYENATTHDFQRTFHKVLGLSLEDFFQDWIYGGGEPHFRVGYETLQKPGKDKAFTEIEIEQIQPVKDSTGYFKVPVVLAVHYRDGTADKKKIEVEKAYHRFRIPNPHNKEITFVLFDPGDRVLKKLTFNKSLPELKAQLIHAPNMIDRYHALEKLRKISPDKKRTVLLKAWYREEFFAVKTEIIRQLMSGKKLPGKKFLRDVLQDHHPKVRFSLIRNTGRIPEQYLSLYEKLIEDSASDIVGIALEKLCDQYPANTAQYLEQTRPRLPQAKGKILPAGNKRLYITWLKIDGRKHPRSINRLVDLTGPSYDFITRKLAINALKSLNYLDDRLISFLTDASYYFNTKLQEIAREALRYYYQQDAYKLRLEAFSADSEKTSERQMHLKALINHR